MSSVRSASVSVPSNDAKADSADMTIEVVRYPASGIPIVELTYSNNELHRDARLGPAGIVYDRSTGKIKRKEYWEHGHLHRDPHDGPAFIEFDPATGLPVLEEWYVHGKLHQARCDKPAVIVRDGATGKILKEEYWKNGQRLKAPRRALRAKTTPDHTP
jgi:hypothetical protein